MKVCKTSRYEIVNAELDVGGDPQLIKTDVSVVHSVTN